MGKKKRRKSSEEAGSGGEDAASEKKRKRKAKREQQEQTSDAKVQQVSAAAEADKPAARSTALAVAQPPKRPTYPYGNYEAYYGYRMSGKSDPRLEAMSRWWFQGAACLDVGCNAGALTLAIARRFDVASMLGVDIDAALVSRARQQLAALVAAAPGEETRSEGRGERRAEVAEGGGGAHAKAATAPAPPSHLSNHDFRRLFLRPSSSGEGGGEGGESGQSAQDGGGCSSSSGASFPANVRFEVCDFAASPPSASQLGVSSGLGSFDVVMCLSTSKWVHLNNGDEGLMRLFRRVHACLRPGGRFVLEPQPWTSYRKRSTLTPTISHHFSTIRIRPNQFAAQLLSTDLTDVGGFRSVEEASVPYAEGTAKGFSRRPFLVFTK